MRRVRMTMAIVIIALVAVLPASSCRPAGFRPTTLKPEDIPADLRTTFLALPIAEGGSHAWHAYGTCSAGTILAATWTHRAPADDRESRMWGIALWEPDSGETSPEFVDRWLAAGLKTDKVFDATWGSGGRDETRYLLAGGYALGGGVDRVVVSTNLGREVTTELCGGWWMVLMEGTEKDEEFAAVQARDQSGKILHDYTADWRAR